MIGKLLGIDLPKLAALFNEPAQVNMERRPIAKPLDATKWQTLYVPQAPVRRCVCGQPGPIHWACIEKERIGQ